MSTMISQTDTNTLSPANTPTTDNSHHHNHHHPAKQSSNQTNTNNLHNGKTPNGFSSNKKRKKFDETIIEGFAIIAFKSWEDLQDELNNEKGLLASANNNNNNNIINSHTNTSNINTNNNLTTDSNTNNNIINNDSHNTADKKSKSKQKCSSTSTTTSSTNSGNSESSYLSSSQSSAASHNYKDAIGKVKKEKSAKKSSEYSLANPKDKRNKTSSSERTDLKKALEAKELAEKRLAIVQAKLKQEKMKNLNIVNINTNNTIVADQYTSPEAPSHVIKEEIHTRTQNNLMNHDMLMDPIAAAPKPSPYPPFQMSSQTHRTESVIHQSMQIHNPPSPPRQSQSHHQHQKHPAHLLHGPPQHSPQPTPPQQQTPIHHHTTTSHTLHQHQTPSQQSPPPQPMGQQHNIVHQHYSRQTPIMTPQTHPHLQHPPSLNPYSSQPPGAMMTPLGLPPLPSPYNCPTSIYITESVSRQTSVIPQPALGAALELPTVPGSSSRFGQPPSVLHSMSQYTPQNLYHPMHYPMLPTERSFMELARNFTPAPNHIVYPSLMNSFPTSSSPSVTANSHSFSRWPRVPLDHHRAVSRYNSLYQSAAAVPNRTYGNFASSRPPTFPAGLFPPPF